MHPKVLSKKAWRLVKTLGDSGHLHGWTLAGGTGLALQLGHRLSEDLDFFRPAPFDSGELLDELSRTESLQVQGRSPSTLHVLISGVRFSFLRSHPPLLFDGVPYRSLVIADPRDIAVMKVVAAGGRGSRKDFIDLYFLIRSTGSLRPILTLLKRRFSKIDHNEYHLLKSLVYFEDAEKEPMPEMIKPLEWGEVKKTLIDEVRRLSP